MDYYSVNEFNVLSLQLNYLCRNEEEGSGPSDVVYSQDCRLFSSPYELNKYIQRYLNNGRINLCCCCEKKKDAKIRNRIPIQGVYEATYESHQKQLMFDFDRILEIFRETNNIAIYGAGNDCNLIIDELYKHNLEGKVKTIFDSNIRRSGDLLRGYKICYPTMEKLQAFDKIFISSRKYGEEIQKELEDKGIDREKIFKPDD